MGNKADFKWSQFFLVFISLFVAVSFFLFLAAPDSSEADSESIGQPEIMVSATSLTEEYNKNEVNADKIYEGKFIGISGKISSIGKDVFDNPYIMFGDGVFAIQCYFERESDIEKLSELEIGDQVTIAGICEGGSILYINMADCRFPKPK